MSFLHNKVTLLNIAKRSRSIFIQNTFFQLIAFLTFCHVTFYCRYKNKLKLTIRMVSKCTIRYRSVTFLRDYLHYPAFPFLMHFRWEHISYALYHNREYNKNIMSHCHDFYRNESLFTFYVHDLLPFCFCFND